MTEKGNREAHLELIHVHHTETGLSGTHEELTALAGWIGQEVDKYNAATEPSVGEVDAVENPLRHLLDDDRTQMVRPAGRLQLIELLYDMSSNDGADPGKADGLDPNRLRNLAGELATTIRCLHHVRENDYVLFVIE